MSKKNDRPPMHGKRRAYGPANEKQIMWRNGYGFDEAQRAKLKLDHAAKQRALKESQELADDIILGII